MSFEEQIEAILGDTHTAQQQQQNNFRAINIGKTPFVGRVLPLEEGEFPFVSYTRSWLSYTNRQGEPTSIPVIFDRTNPNDVLGKLIANVFFYNRSQMKATGSNEEAIKIASGRFGLQMQERSTFLGVRVGPNQQGAYVEEIDGNTNQEVINAFDISHGMLRNLVELLKPSVPYMNNQGQPLFNTPLQFISAGQTFPVELKSTQGSDRHWSSTANALNQIALPPMSFNYLEKEQDGSYKYIPNLKQERRPLLETSPTFYEKVYNYVKESVDTQMNKLGITTLDTRNQTRAPQAQGFTSSQPSPTPQPSMTTNSVPQSPNFGSQAPTQQAPSFGGQAPTPQTPNFSNNPENRDGVGNETTTWPPRPSESISNEQPFAGNQTTMSDDDLPFSNTSQPSDGSQLESSQSLDDFLDNI